MQSPTDIIREEFHRLGIAKHYHGYRQALLATELAVEDETRLLRIVEQIYEEVAVRCGCSACCVERNIRTISHKAWKNNPHRLRELSGYPRLASPSVSEFISIMTAHVQRKMRDAERETQRKSEREADRSESTV